MARRGANFGSEVIQKFGVSLLVTAGIIVVAIFYSFYYSGKILDADNPSESIVDSIEKGIFIDSLEILSPDTIRTNKYERADLLPVSCWLEKKAFWKSGKMDFDSLEYKKDTVLLIVRFEDFVNGQPRRKSNGDYSIIEFHNHDGTSSGVLLNENTLSFEMDTSSLLDTMRLVSTDGQQILIGRGK